MKLERVPEYFVTALVILIGMLLAVYIGTRLGTGNYRSVVLIVGGLCFLVIGAVMGKNVWLLIPLSLLGAGSILTLPLTMAEAGMITAFGWWVIFTVFRQVTFKPQKPGFIDLLLWVNVLYVLTMYIRNPVGLLFVQSDQIGGRPYFAILFALMAYWVLSRVELKEVWARRLPWLIVASSLPGFAAGMLAKFIPATASATAFIFGIGGAAEVDPAAVFSKNPDATEIRRYDTFAAPSIALLTAIFAYLPFRTLLNPLYIGRVLVIAAGLVLILFSGFRNMVAVIFFYFIIIALYRGAIGSVVRVGLWAVPCFILILAGHGTFYKFPFGIQRALSPLPAKWDYAPVASAKDSSEWRKEMGKMMMEGDGYLKSRWLGDGFGFNAQEQIRLHFARMGGNRQSEYEYFILVGDVHSGPLSGIRFAGYVGTGLFFALMLALAYKAHRLILRSRRTPYEFPILVIGVPLTIYPFFYAFVFGAYNTAVAQIIVQIGILKMLENALNRHFREQKVAAQALADAETSKSEDERPKELPQPA